MMLGRMGFCSLRTNEITSKTAPSATSTRSGHHRCAWMLAWKNGRGIHKRPTQPASAPVRNTSAEATSITIKVCRKKRHEPVMVAREKPTHGVNSGAKRIPSRSKAGDSNRYAAPRTAPHRRAKRKNSMDGNARLERFSSKEARSVAPGMVSRREACLRRERGK